MKPFDFPIMWGKLGNWPGIVSIVGAQAILQKIATFKSGAKIVQLGFDGGRVAIIAGWGAGSNGHQITIVGQPSTDMSTEIWFNRAVHLWNMQGFCHRAYDCDPFECDMILANQYDDFIAEWSSYLRIGGAFCLLGNASTAQFADEDFTKIVDIPGQIGMWDRNVITKHAETHRDNVIVLPERSPANGHAPGAFESVPLPIELPELSTDAEVVENAQADK